MKQLCNRKVRDFAMALRARKVSGAFEKRPPELSNSNQAPSDLPMRSWFQHAGNSLRSARTVTTSCLDDCSSTRFISKIITPTMTRSLVVYQELVYTKTADSVDGAR